jgi:hypothetical protein
MFESHQVEDAYRQLVVNHPLFQYIGAHLAERQDSCEHYVLPTMLAAQPHIASGGAAQWLEFVADATEAEDGSSLPAAAVRGMLRMLTRYTLTCLRSGLQENCLPQPGDARGWGELLSVCLDLHRLKNEDARGPAMDIADIPGVLAGRGVSLSAPVHAREDYQEPLDVLPVDF